MAQSFKKQKSKIRPGTNQVLVKPVIDKKSVLLSLVLLAAVGLAVYANVLSGQLLWDDETLIIENPYIRNMQGLLHLLLEPIGAGIGRADSYYRPLQMLTYMLDHAVWRLNPFGYHLTNVLLHILAAMCLWGLLFFLFGDSRMALWTSLLFVVHPVHTEAVAYVAGRADPLVLIFSLLCALFYVMRFRKATVLSYVFMVGSFCLALLARENSLVLPVLLLLLHYVSRVKFRQGDWFSLLACGIIFIVVRVALLPTTVSHTVIDTPFDQRLCGFFVALARYVKLLILPWPLHMEYAKEEFSMATPQAWAGLVLLAAAAFFIFSRRRSDRFLVFCLGWFFVALLPFANIYPIKTYMAEHWLYMPSIGIFLLMVRGFLVLRERLPKKMAATWLLVGLLAVYAVLTVRQNMFWRNAVDLFTMTMKYSPRSLQAHVNLGLAYGRAGDEDMAKDFYEKAIVLNDNSAEAHNNLANIYLRQEYFDEAIRHYKKAIESESRYAQAYYNLGNVYKELKQPQEALEMYKKAIELLPDLAGPYNNLGVEYYRQGNKDQAIELFEKIILIRPDYAGAYNNLANVYKEIGRKGEAVELYRKTIALDPNFFMAYYNLGLLYQALGRPEEALDMYRGALRLKPDYADAQKSLDELLAALRKQQK